MKVWGYLKGPEDIENRSIMVLTKVTILVYRVLFIMLLSSSKRWCEYARCSQEVPPDPPTLGVSPQDEDRQLTLNPLSPPDPPSRHWGLGFADSLCVEARHSEAELGGLLLKPLNNPKPCHPSFPARNYTHESASTIWSPKRY